MKNIFHELFKIMIVEGIDSRDKSNVNKSLKRSTSLSFLIFGLLVMYRIDMEDESTLVFYHIILTASPLT